MTGPWVVVRIGRPPAPGLALGRVEFLDAEDRWTLFLADSNVLASEHVAQHLAAELEDEGHGECKALPLAEARKLVGDGSSS